MYCDYGCGKKFNYILKNGKKCCSSTFYKCNGYKKKLSNSLKKKKKCFKCNKYINISHYKRHIELCGKTVLCKNCNKKIPYYKKFCNTSCAASFNNKIRNRQNSQNKLRQCYISYCKYCNKIIKGKNRKFCNSYCQSKYNKKINTEKWLAGEISGTVMSGGPTNFVREYIYKKFKYKCSKCGWNKIDLKPGKSPLHIHHLDGNRRNNEEYNLDLLCPNCHWLTDTFGGRNQARSLKMKGIKMSEILKRIREDLKSHMLNEIRLRKEETITGNGYDIIIAHKTVARAIISMFPEIGKKPADATDDNTIKLLKKYIKNEKERLLYTDKHITESDVNGLNSTQLKALVLEKFKTLDDKLTSIKIKIAQKYLPKQATEEEIRAWIHENIDFSLYKNKMQAMGPIMKQFKGCDGNFVKNLLIKLS